MHRYVPSDHTQKMHEAEFWIFALKVDNGRPRSKLENGFW